MRPSGRIQALVLVAAVFAVGGCGGGGGSGSGSGPAATPTVTVLVANTDCPVGDIQIQPFTVEQANSGGAFILRIRATVTCNGAPVSGATLTFTIPGGTTPTTADTDASGNATASPLSPNNANLEGQTVSVSVTGADGKAYPKPPPATVTKAP